MQFKTIKQMVENVIDSVEQSAIASVRSLKQHTFKSQITNFPKTQQVKGTVTVGNQKNLESEVKKVEKSIKNLEKTIGKIDIPDSVSVKNFPKPEKFPKFPKKISVDNFPDFPQFPKSFEVENQPVEYFIKLQRILEDVRYELKKMKLDPKINVQAPPQDRVVVPPPTVTVTQEEIDYEKLAELFSESGEKMDYEKLADVLGEKLASMVITGGGGGGKYAYKNSEGQGTTGLVDEDRAVRVKDYQYKLQEKDVSDTNLMYFGSVTASGKWEIKKITNQSQVRYAYGDSDFSTNWTNRASLTYGTDVDETPSDAIIATLMGSVESKIYGIALDGPNVGEFVAGGMIYNSTEGYYELATNGSTTSSTPTTTGDGTWDSTDTNWNDTSVNWDQT